MTLTRLSTAAFCAAALSLAATAVQAAPASNLKLDGAGTTSLEPVATRCWWSGGAKRCRQGYRPQRYGYRSTYRELNNPDAHRAGSRRWWQEMDRLDRGGRGSRG